MADCAGFSKSPTEYGRQVQFYTMEVLGNGSVVQRDKSKPRGRCRKWELSVRVRLDNGDKATKTRPFHGTYGNAVKAKGEFVAELSDDRRAPDGGMTVSEWWDEWSTRRGESGSVSKRTLDTDAQKAKCVLERIGDMDMNDVSPDDVRDLYRSAALGNTPSGKPWKPATVLRMHTMLLGMFGDAVRDGLISRSPMDRVDAPRQSATDAGRAMPSPQMDSLLDALDYSHPMHRAVALALACGLRRSECCALFWDDVSDGRIHVHCSSEDDGSPKPTKTGRARSVPVPARVWDALERERGTGPVVGMLPHSVTRWWMTHRDSLGCSGYRFHDLRHSYATRLAANDVHMRVAMELCGWSSVDTAMRVYTHVSDTMQRDAVARSFS